MILPKFVTLVEVGPRDGLQNEPETISTTDKLKFIEILSESGLKEIEVTSFVRPDQIPQLSDAALLANQLPSSHSVLYSALVPNLKGLERARSSGIKKIAVFTAASETFNQKNIHASIQESLDRFKELIPEAQKIGMEIRGYISTGFVCPFEGDVPKEKVLEVAEKLLEMGIGQISIGDTIGAASPKDVEETIGFLLAKISAGKIALHFHDTYGTALANVYAALQLGITTFDSSAGGLGGCPFAPGAAGNIGTEDLIYFFHRMGIKTGVDLNKIFEASSFISNLLKRPLSSRQWQRLRSQQKGKNSGNGK